MTYGSNEKGEATFTLSKSEHESFKRGEPVVKKTGDKNGDLKIIIQMSRPVKPTIPINFDRAANTVRRSYGTKHVVKVGLEDNDGCLTLTVKSMMGDYLFMWNTGEQGNADSAPYLGHVDKMMNALHAVGIQATRLLPRTC